MDVLSEILQAVRLRGTMYFHAHFQSPWGMEISNGQFANYHIVTEGQCWVSFDNSSEKQLKLNQGDILLFPGGHYHALLDSPNRVPVSAKKLLQESRKNDSDETIFGGDGRTSCSLICGHFEYDRDLSHPVFETLPPFIHISRANISDSDWYITATQLAAKLSNNKSKGSNAVIDRLAETLLLQILVDYVEQHEEQQSFLAALQDNGISRALNVIHQDIAHNWNLAELAEIALMSRTSFAQKFHLLVGEPPIVYLARWRMIKAQQLMSKKLPLKTISETVGYQSEYSFSKAFKKMTGVSPGAYKKSLLN